MPLNDFQRELCESSPFDFSALRALFVNCTLKPSPDLSHTQGLIDVSVAIMEANGVAVDQFRAVDHDLAPGVYPDMREHGADSDGWPALYERVQAADILVVATPIWLGEKSSVCTRLIERLYGNSSQLNEQGQYAYYGKVGGCLVTGNEDGVKHCSMNVLYSLQHLGYTIPPQADAGWIGEAGPGPSYLDPGSGGPENDFTQRNTTVHDLERASPRPDAQGGGRSACSRKPALEVGRRLPLRPSEPGLPLIPLAREGSATGTSSGSFSSLRRSTRNARQPQSTRVARWAATFRSGPLTTSTAEAGDGARTHDPQLGKLMLYQLSYARSSVDSSSPRRPSYRRGGVHHRCHASALPLPHSTEQQRPRGTALVGDCVQRERPRGCFPRVDTLGGADRYRADGQMASGDGDRRRKVDVGAAAGCPRCIRRELTGGCDLHEPDARRCPYRQRRDVAVPAPNHRSRHRPG